MKRHIINIAIIGSLVFSVSCKKVLQTTPTSFLAPANYFQTQTQIDTYLASVYDVLNNDVFWYRDQFRTQISEGTDESYSTNTAALAAHYSAAPTETSVNNLWKAIYQGVERANTLLENIDKASGLTDAYKRHTIGECKFLRAYYLFTATQHFGDVPLKITSTKSPADGQIAFTPSKAVYDYVIQEMTDAEAMLIDQKASNLSYTERVTYTTVEAMLARVCLFAAGNPVNDTKRYADALAWAKKVVASGEHRLNPDYRQIFINESADLYDNTYHEVMWEVGFYFNASLPALREITNPLIGVNNNSINPYGKVAANTRSTAILYRAYTSTYNPTAQTDASPDIRRDWCVAPYTLTGGTTTTNPTEVPIAWNSWWMRYPGKWRRQYETARPIDPNNSPQNSPLMRYSDVLLMLAEAENEVNGPTSVAYDAINQVRRRGYGTGSRVSSVTITNAGTGYTTVPTITIGASLTFNNTLFTVTNGATATALISGGKITSINITSPNAFYTTVPTVTITGGNGTGATATAVLQTIDQTAADLTPGLTRDDFRLAIQNERLKELNGEFLRRQDLKRWGILLSTVKSRGDLASSGGTNRFPNGVQMIPPLSSSSSNVNDLALAIADGQNITDRFIYLPIPSSEITTNAKSKQNPGF